MFCKGDRIIPERYYFVDRFNSFELYRVAGKRGLSDWEKCVDSVAPALKTVLDTPLELKSDTTILWVTVKLKDKVDLTIV